MLEVHKSNMKLETYMNMDVFNDETKERAKRADILLLPNLEMRGEDRVFQPNTVDFYKYSVVNQNNDYKIELFENKGEEKILALHSFDIWMPIIAIGTEFLLPIVTGLVTNYVGDRMKGRPNDEPTVHFELLVENKEKGTSKHISYKGSVEGFKESFEKIDVNKFWEE